MLTPLLIVIPIFSLILAGYVCRKTAVMGATASGEINRFVVYLALPALLFKVVAHASWGELYQPGFIATFSLGCGVVFALTLSLRGKLARRPLADSALDGLNAAYANTAFIGFPLALAAFGPATQAPVTIASILTVCVIFAVAIILIETGLQSEKGTKRHPVRLLLNVGQSLTKNPLLIAPVVGAVFSTFHLPIPQSAEAFLTLLGGAASPCALVALGLFLAEKRPSERTDPGSIFMLVGLKLFLHPLLTWLFATHVFHLNPLLCKTAVLLSALPTGTGPFMLAEFYQREASTTSNAILISTLLSLVTVSVLLFYLG